MQVVDSISGSHGFVNRRSSVRIGQPAPFLDCESLAYQELGIRTSGWSIRLSTLQASFCEDFHGTALHTFSTERLLDVQLDLRSFAAMNDSYRPPYAPLPMSDEVIVDEDERPFDLDPEEELDFDEQSAEDQDFYEDDELFDDDEEFMEDD